MGINGKIANQVRHILDSAGRIIGYRNPVTDEDQAWPSDAVSALVSGAGLLGRRSTTRKRCMAFGNSLATQNNTQLFASNTSLCTTDTRAGSLTLPVTATQGALFTGGDKIAIALYTNEVFLTTVASVAGDVLTLSAPLPKMVRGSASSLIQKYTTAAPTGIYRDIGALTGAVALLGGAIDVVQGYGYGGSIAQQITKDLPAWLRAVEPDYVYLQLPDNDVGVITTAQYKDMAIYACQLCLATGAIPLLATPVPLAFGGTAASPTASAPKAAWWDDVVAWTATIGSVVPGAIPINMTQWINPANAANVRAPLAAVASDGTHPDVVARWLVASYFAAQLPAAFSDTAGYLSMKRGAVSANSSLTGSAGTFGNLNSGVGSGTVADTWVVESNGTGVTNVCSKNSDGSQKIVFAVAGTGNQTSTVGFLRQAVALSVDFGSKQTLRPVVKLRVNSMSGMAMILAQLVYASGGEIMGTATVNHYEDTSIVGKVHVLEGPDIAIPDGATSVTLRLYLRPKTGSSNPTCDIDVFDAFAVCGSTTPLVA